jgi:hypothetical protein
LSRGSREVVFVFLVDRVKTVIKVIVLLVKSELVGQAVPCWTNGLWGFEVPWN